MRMLAKQQHCLKINTNSQSQIQGITTQSDSAKTRHHKTLDLIEIKDYSILHIYGESRKKTVKSISSYKTQKDTSFCTKLFISSIMFKTDSEPTQNSP